MAFTDHSDLYGAIHETGINRVVRHIMRQRPSLFNYGTALIARNPRLLCAPIDAAPAVYQRNNPLLSVEDPLPIVGTEFGLNYCFQFTKFEVDFFPGNTIALPGELNPPLANQRFALHGQVCAGLGCPDDRTLEATINMAREMARADYFTGALLTAAELQNEQPYLSRMRQAPAGEAALAGDRQVARPQVKRALIPLPCRELLCFCLDLYVIGHIDVQGPAGQETIQPRVDGMDIQDIKPDNMEDSFLCYVDLLLKLAILPKARVALPVLMFDLMTFATVTLSATPVSAAVPHNPAIEDDQAKVFINLKMGPPPPPAPPAPPPPPAPPAPTRHINWSLGGPPEPAGPSHLTVAANHKAVENLFAAVRDGYVFTKSNSGNFGPFSAGYDVAFHLENGNLQLRNDGTISIKQLDVKWDHLGAWLGINIPEICVGGFCIIPNPFSGGCAVRAPEICIFSGNPDLSVGLDLGGFITSEVSMAAGVLTKYGVEATRPAGLSDLDAEDMSIPNEWGVFMDPEWVNIDVFDIADMVADLLTNAITTAITGLLPGPQWAKDAIMAIIGPIIDFVRAILGIPHQIVDWLSDLLGVSLGLLSVIVQLILEYFTRDAPLAKIEDPFPVAKAQGGLIPIKLPIRDLAVHVDANELTLAAKVGA